MKVAVEGCAHGELEKIYETIQFIEKDTNIKVDLLLCCGDFQSTRNIDDLQTMAVPKKFHNMGSFYKYYSGELVAPILTIFIGGNHEASNYLQELPYGGWVAPNIYYLGYAGVVRVNGLRIAGISGIYKGYDYLKGRFEFSPYTDSTKTSVYHIRQLEVFRLRQLSGDIDMFMSHDWPRGIFKFGNEEQLLRLKPHFRDDIDNNELGSKPCEELLYLLQPKYWFSAHLHCKFAALVPHKSYDPADYDDEPEKEKTTKFLALDKCLPKRRFLQVLAVEPRDCNEEGIIKFEYDLEWLTILYLTNNLTNAKASKYYLPNPANENCTDRYKFTPTPEELKHVRSKFPDLTIPHNFCRTVDPYDGYTDYKNCEPIAQPKSQSNLQNTKFCDKLGIDDPVAIAMHINGQELIYTSSMTENSLLTASGLETKTTDSLNNVISDASLKVISALNLPKPTIKSALQNAEEIPLDEDCDEETSNIDDSNSNKKLPEHTEEGTACATAVRKLKRRNQEMYESTEEQQPE